jgi:hypothetical protein
MAHVIEAAKSGRSTCRSCQQLIEKAALRFGVETQGFDGNPGHVWHHLACAAKKLPAQVRETLPVFTGEIPNRAEIDALLSAAPEKAPAAEKTYPFAERASTGRAKCMECENAIEKGTFRIGVERDIEVMGVMRKGPGYYHPACAKSLGDGLREKLEANSALTPEELQELSGRLS